MKPDIHDRTACSLGGAANSSVALLRTISPCDGSTLPSAIPAAMFGHNTGGQIPAIQSLAFTYIYVCNTMHLKGCMQFFIAVSI